MSINYLPVGKRVDGQLLKIFVEAGLIWLRANQQIVNALNVFPVPDGDTGTNMVLTMQAAYDEIIGSSETNFGKMAHAIAHGALMGARGNSGVILSQLWRGFARSLDNEEFLDAQGVIKALSMARDTAYKGVVRPVEGTILTVAKDVAAAAERTISETEEPVEILEYLVHAADQSVKHTPELLAVLKEAGVVDSGGKGLYYLLEGMLRYSLGQTLEFAPAVVQPLEFMSLERVKEIIEPGQDFEVVVDFIPHKPLNLEVFYNELEQMGTSIQIGEGENMYRLHIHVPKENLYQPLEYTRNLGIVTKAAIENLVAQIESQESTCSDESLSLAPVQPGNIAVVAVVPGQGLARVFASLGVAAVVSGGQTMNPSTLEIIRAFEDLPTDQVIILPNNKNIILTGNTAAEISLKNVAVIPSRSIPQGLNAMLRLIPDGDFASVVAEMTAAIDEVITGEITIATRDVEIDGVQVQEGQIIALLNGKLVLSALTIEEACLGLLDQSHAQEYELITLFYGLDISRSEVDQIVKNVEAKYPDLEIEIQEGCQPHYPFIMSIE